MEDDLGTKEITLKAPPLRKSSAENICGDSEKNKSSDKTFENRILRKMKARTIAREAREKN